MTSCNHHYIDNSACIHNVPIFRHLTKEEQQSILDTSITKTYQKGEIIFSTTHLSNNLWVVNKGKVKVSRLSKEGREQVLRVLFSGDFLGDLSLFSNKPMNSDAYALEKTEICIINGNDLKKVIQKNPTIAIKFLEVYSERIQASEAMVEQIGIYDIDQRIAKTLLELAMHAKSSQITLPYSKTDFASMIGSSRETLSRKLSLFQNQGWITQSGQRKITLLDKESLEGLLI